MKIFKNSVTHMLLVSFFSMIYSVLFMFISGHMEFLSLIEDSNESSPNPFHLWVKFLKNGNLKYVGYAIIALTIIIILVFLIKRVYIYDEYQRFTIAKSLAVSGIIYVIFMPFLIILAGNRFDYIVELIVLLGALQWILVLIKTLVDALKF